ncbi:hypothetical protein [Allochromatium vinosum]|uniref:hypothetical protein n=1 Tax=Allochromatium vinosum TaxID=1049 RepID=UPI0019049416|nr:hypothetical protein [Allochromatium vinosum]MBK1653363.1 hypothetical protein [Allochromatium vinosum]
MKTALLTPETPFSYVPSIDANLFSVRAGVPLAITAEQCACSVDAATETVRRVACSISTDDGAHLLWSAVYTLTLAHGLIESIQAALEDLEPSKAFSYYIAPADHTAPGPFTWFVVNDANERVIQYGTADTWSEADQIACDTIERLEQEPEPAPEPANPDPADDPEVMRRTWTDLAEMAAGQLAKLDEAKPAMQIDAALVRAYMDADAALDVADGSTVLVFNLVENSLFRAITEATGIDPASLKTFGQIVREGDGLLLLGEVRKRVLKIGADGRITWLDGEQHRGATRGAYLDAWDGEIKPSKEGQ